MPLRYDDLSASQAFLKATMAVNDLTTDLHKHHGAVRDFMREILSSVCCCPVPIPALGAAVTKAPPQLQHPHTVPPHMPDVRRTLLPVQGGA